MNLEHELNVILAKYQLHNVASKFIYEMYNVIVSVLNSISFNDKIIIRGAGEHTERLIEIARDNNIRLNIVGIIDDEKSGMECVGVKITPVNSIDKINYDKVIISSYTYRNDIKLEFDREQEKIVDIYSELEKADFKLQAPFYFYTVDGHEIPIYFLKKYADTPSEENLIAVIDSLFGIRDILSAIKYVKKYILKGYKNGNRYVGLVNDINDLMNKVKDKLVNRNMKDVVMLWTDGVSYSDVGKIPFLCQRKNSSLFFEHTYTCTPFTLQTTNLLLRQDLPIDDFENFSIPIKKNNSNVIQYLYKMGYEFKHIGGVDGVDGHNGFDDECCVLKEDKTIYGTRTSCTVVLWKVIHEILQSKVPQFCIAHMIIETHLPCISVDVWDECSYKRNEIIQSGQIDKSYKYISSQLEFYDNLFADNMIRIYMSDHGNHFNFPEWYFSEKKIRPYFMVYGKGIQPDNNKRIFYYINFYYLVKWIIEGKDSDYENVMSDYALFQDFDIRNPNMVNNFLHSSYSEYAMTYRGIVTIKDKYVLLGNGHEFYYILPDEQNNLINSNLYKNRINYLKKIVGNKFIDREKNSGFEYSKLLYE